MSHLETMRRRMTIARVGRVLALAVGLGGASLLAGATAMPTPSVRIADFRFQPSEFTVERGSTVVWVNQDDEIHAIVAADGSFSSPGLDTDGEFAHEFDAPGSYEYRCALHPQMKGTIVVR